MLSQKLILGHMEVETKMFISKAKQRKDRHTVHSPDTGAGTSDNRCNECSYTPWVFMVKKWVGGLAQICLRKECSSLSDTWYISSFLLLHCFINWAQGPKVSSF
jgi:hypothetical protein